MTKLYKDLRPNDRIIISDDERNVCTISIFKTFKGNSTRTKVLFEAPEHISIALLEEDAKD
jgi:hypothetical protein